MSRVDTLYRTSSLARIERLEQSQHWSGSTLHGLLAQASAARPQQLAVADPSNRAELLGDTSAPYRLNFDQLQQAASALAVQLREQGVSAGDVVAVQLPNIVELVVCYFAISQLGAVISPLPVQYRSHEINTLCNQLAPVAVVTCRQFKQQPLASHWQQAAAALPCLVWGEALQLDALLNSRAPAVAAASDANAIVSLCWTSGTTGTPKAVPRSHNMWLASARACISAGNYRDGDRLLNPFPLVNMAAIASFLYPMVMSGCSVILHHPLEVPLFLQQLVSEQITYTVAPPALLNQLAKSPALWQQLDTSHLRAIGSGSAPLSAWMVETFERDFATPIVNLYGSNEGVTLFATAENCPEPTLRATQFPLPPQASGIRCAVVDVDSRQPLRGDGERGELLIAGPTVFDGYANSVDRHCFQTIDGEEYFCSGDLVELCQQGRQIRIVGRCKELINRGGEKISPVELEQILEQMAEIAEIACYGYPDERLGERVAAAVVVADGHPPPTLEHLAAFLQQRGVAKSKWPEQLQLVAELPRNPLGKVQRFSLRAAA